LKVGVIFGPYSTDGAQIWYQFTSCLNFSLKCFVIYRVSPSMVQYKHL